MSLTNFFAHFRRRPSNAAAIAELTHNAHIAPIPKGGHPTRLCVVDALFTRIDHTSSVLACVFMRRNLSHAQARATLLEGRNRGLVATVSDQAQTIEALRAQLDAARSLIDRRTVALRVAEEAWAAESQRVMDLEDEARLWITRARENCVVSEN